MCLRQPSHRLDLQVVVEVVGSAVTGQRHIMHPLPSSRLSQEIQFYDEIHISLLLRALLFNQVRYCLILSLRGAQKGSVLKFSSTE